MTKHQLKDFHFSDTHGFLLVDQEEGLPEQYTPWEQVGLRVAELLTDHSLREAVHQMPELSTTALTSYPHQRRAYMLLTFMCNGYVWQEGDSGVPQKLPRQVAVPLCTLSTMLGLQPAVTHAAFALSNWKLIDPTGPFTAENMTTFCRFPGGRQMEWFTVVTVEIEKKAVSGVKAAIDVLRAATDGNEAGVIKSLREMTDSISEMRTSLKKMYVGLESDVFFDVIRPYLSGWGGEGNPLPQGLIYDGVSIQPIKVNGGSAAQSSILGCFDVTLGLQHDEGRQVFLNLMLNYMPTAHRELILHLRQTSTLRDFVYSSARATSTELLDAYSACVQMLTDFRSDHIQLVTKYIVIPSHRQARHKNFEGVAEKGTGGTELIPFLKSLRDTTKSATT